MAWRLPYLLLIPLGMAVPKIAAAFPQWIEAHYSKQLYPIINQVLGKAVRFFSGSIAELVLLLGASVLLLWFLYEILLLFLKKDGLFRFLSFLLSLGITAGFLLNLFYLLWGFNYFRPTLYQLMDLPVENRPISQLESLCHDLAQSARSWREQVEENDQGVFVLEDGYLSYFSEIPEAYAKLGKEYHLFQAQTYPAKGVHFSKGLSYANISGIYIPYTAECNVNVDQPALLLLSSAAHETAHFLGFAKEDEANFIAYLSCSRSSNPSIAYSGTMNALIYCANQLYASDPEKYSALRATYSDGMLRDLQDYSAYWAEFEGPVEKTFDTLNDNYLKFNQQEAGVKSYGMMVDLLLAYWAEDKF